MAFTTGDLGTPPDNLGVGWQTIKEMEAYLTTMIAALDAALVDHETRITTLEP